MILVHLGPYVSLFDEDNKNKDFNGRYAHNLVPKLESWGVSTSRSISTCKDARKPHGLGVQGLGLNLSPRSISWPFDYLGSDPSNYLTKFQDVSGGQFPPYKPVPPYKPYMSLMLYSPEPSLQNTLGGFSGGGPQLLLLPSSTTATAVLLLLRLRPPWKFLGTLVNWV